MRCIVKWISIVLISACVFCPEFASAEKITFPAQVRLFVGTTSATPTDVNTELNSDGLNKMSHITKYGFEIGYPLLKFFNIGLRYTLRHDLEDEIHSTSNHYFGQIDQNEVMLIGRIPLLKTNLLRLDAFGGFGGTNTTFKLKTLGQDGELSKKDPGAWFASASASYGASLSIGWKHFYLVFESGFESNRVKGGFKADGVTTNINSIDLSGGYFTVGVLIDGMEVTRE